MQSSVNAPPATILVIEDEAPIAAAVAARLRSEGHRVEVAFDGPSGVELASLLQPDLVVLDLMLPGLDGLEVCARIQAERTVPVLVLTARDGEDEIVAGLVQGADDYVTKPFGARELVARVHALLRRASRPSSTRAPMTMGDVTLDPATRAVTRDGEPVHLTPTEFDLLQFLGERRGQVVTRDLLLAEVWGYPADAGGRTVDSHVRALRRKLGPDLVRTVHGVGYGVDVP